MIYRTIIATKFCFTQGGPLKINYKTLSNITFTCKPDGIPTMGCFSTFVGDHPSSKSLVWSQSWIPINYSDLLTNITSVNTFCGPSNDAETSTNWISVDSESHHPFIMFEQDLRTLDPAWRSCTLPPFFWDPPRALEKVSALTSMFQSLTTSTIAASPGLRMPLPGATKTATLTHPPVSNLYSQDTPSPGNSLRQSSPQGLQSIKSSAPGDPASEYPAAQNPSPQNAVTASPSSENSVGLSSTEQISSVQDLSSKYTVTNTVKSIQKPADSGLLIAGSSIAVESQATTSGHFVSVDSSTFMVDGITYARSALPESGVGQDPNSNIGNTPGDTLMKIAGFTLVDQKSTVHSASAAIGGTVISAGGSGTSISGTQVSVLPSGEGILVGSSTIIMSTVMHTGLTLFGHTITAIPSGLTIDGNALPVHGQSVATSASTTSFGSVILQIGSSTFLLASGHGDLPTESMITLIQATSEQDLGALILGAFGAATTSTSVQPNSTTHPAMWNNASGSNTPPTMQFMGKGSKFTSDVWVKSVMVMLCTFTLALVFWL